MDINFELYKIFYHAAKAGSFSEAAKQLYISQSAVSQSIGNLESKLGGQLFYRKTRNVSLTPDGELLFKHIGQAYNFIKTAESKLVEMRNLDSGEIRIGVSDTVCKYFLIPFMEKFNLKYPKIKIQVINRTSSQIISIVKNGLADFGIVTLPIHDKGLIAEEFLSVEDIFIANDRFSDLKGTRVNLSELSAYPLLMLQKNSMTRQNTDNFFKQRKLDLTPEIELESVDLLVEFAKIGLGIAHVLKESAQSSIKSCELFEVETKEKLPPRKLGIVTIKTVPGSRASSEFIKLLKHS